MTQPEYSSLIEEFRNPNGSIDLEKAREIINRRFADEGYDGLNVRPTKHFDERQVLIFNESVNKLKTKSQLKDIWNKANR